MVQRGVAPTTGDIVSQLKSKFPKRKNIVGWPGKKRVDHLRILIKGKAASDIDIDECEDEEKPAVLSNERVKSEALLEMKKSIENDFQAVHVHWEDILKVASRAKKSTGGGLCPLTPWHIRSAILNSSGSKCFKMLAL